MLNAGTVVAAANIRTAGGKNRLSEAEFLEMYPQFSTVPLSYLEMITEQANAAILESRWHTKWRHAVCLYIAHYCTLYLKTTPPEGASDAVVARRGDGAGNVTSKSVGGVSVSYGAAEGASDLTGYGAWKETEFGLQLATLARMVGKGMMVIR